ncbi:LITAF-like zinc ribbon domain-containing protein [Halteromyces radiatus]|uniref:LITAF-like zinc ribbon domain-containing protein n=1 Tax=Halteromyces radiatus TaxID=101107 RepID=UPI00221F2CF4|nr:LITAF-like zinc ribbon domain-containing protein [Halteromyces radiatus]KAI8084837.1 LITAF-like zinc ribbon domain-containing protein [Halteromyces radiatus]
MDATTKIKRNKFHSKYHQIIPSIFHTTNKKQNNEKSIITTPSNTLDMQTPDIVLNSSSSSSTTPTGIVTASSSSSSLAEASTPATAERRRRRRHLDHPLTHSPPPPSSSVPSAASQLLVSSHVPCWARSNQSFSSSLSSMADHSDSLQSAYSNERQPSIIRSDRVYHYRFATPTHPGEDDDDDDDSSSRFSYHVTTPSSHQQTGSSSQPPTEQLNRSSFPFLRRSYFSRFNSRHRQQSVISNDSRNNHTSIISSKSSRLHSRSHILFLGRSLPDFETLVYCSVCEKWIQSRLRYRSGAMVWLASFVLLMCTVFLFWIPFYIKYFKDTIHYCPSCGCEIGRSSII